MMDYFPVCAPLLTQEMLGSELWVQYVAFYNKHLHYNISFSKEFWVYILADI